MLSLLLLPVLLAAGASDPLPRLRQPIDPEPERGSDPEPDLGPFPNRYLTSPTTLSARSRSYGPAPILPPVPPDPLRLACPVCGAAVGVRCDPERLGKAGRRGAVAHKERR